MLTLLFSGLVGVDGEATEDTVSELVDPEAASEIRSTDMHNSLMEKKYGLTRLILEASGVQVVLQSIQQSIAFSLQKIKRDDVCPTDDMLVKKNLQTAMFRTTPPCQGLALMRHCSRLADNRIKLLQAHAPTMLLSLLLDVLKALEEPEGNADTKSSPTAELLQELIESLTSEMTEVGSNFQSGELAQDTSSLSLLLQSIEISSLGPSLRNVIAKLLPFMTYGQPELCKALAMHFDRHIVLTSLTETETDENVSMNTFIETAIALQTNKVCNALRSALVECGFVESLCRFILEGMPKHPPPWSAALWPDGKQPEPFHDLWRKYIKRDGIRTAFKILGSLSKGHDYTQATIGESAEFVLSCHWLEATSDNLDLDMSMNGLGLLAETLLDEIVIDSSNHRKSVDSFRAATRIRKKELALDRRKQTLTKMGSFGSTKRIGKGVSLEKPAWLEEMEAIEEDNGLVCVICQEGRKNQPSELLGLYAYVRKVVVPLEKCGSRSNIDGSVLLNSLSKCGLKSFADHREAKEWFPLGKAAGEHLATSSSICLSSLGSRRSSVFTTTVSAGNGIHLSCHIRARQVDRTHGKAPKSEWEGAKLRNGRVDCNIIFPLVSSRSSKVSLMSVDSGKMKDEPAQRSLVCNDMI